MTLLPTPPPPDAGAHEVLALDAAARRLPLDHPDALQWLEATGLTHDLLGQRVVIWADALDALRGNPKRPPHPDSVITEDRAAGALPCGRSVAVGRLRKSGLSVVGADRLALGRAAVLSVGRAAELLPIGEERARRWLMEQGLVRELAGRFVVVWGDVLDGLGSEGKAEPKRTAPKKLHTLPRHKF